MYASRRAFLSASVTLVAATAARAAQQRRPSSPFPVPSQGPAPPPSPLPPVPRPDRAVLKANRETITKDVSRMAELVEQLQKALDANSTTEVLSLDVLRKSEEIEKLAKQVKDLVRG